MSVRSIRADVRAARAKVGDRVGCWEIVALLGHTPAPHSRLRVRVRCVRCGTEREKTHYNLRVTRNACSWSPGAERAHVGRPRAAARAD